MPHQKFCGSECQKKYSKEQLASKYVRKISNQPRSCMNCGEKFKPKSGQQKYCSESCRLEKLGKPVKTEVICEQCGITFMPRIQDQMFCGKQCRQVYYRLNSSEEQKKRNYESVKRSVKKTKEKQKEKSIMSEKKQANFTNFGDLYFRNESDFEKWFEKNYVLFGIKRLLKINRMFPDVIAETFDGMIIRVELEYSALNFIAHEHDPSGCDLIISYVKPFHIENIVGVPVISLFNAKGLKRGATTHDLATMELTNYFNSLVRSINERLSSFINHESNFDFNKQASYQVVASGLEKSYKG